MNSNHMRINPSTVRLKDSEGNLVDPSNEDKQQLLLQNLQSEEGGIGDILKEILCTLRVLTASVQEANDTEFSEEDFPV